MKIEGSVAIVTGGASGLGEAAVKRLVAENCKVVIADIQEERGKALAESLGSDKAIFIKTNVADEASVQNLIDKTVEKFGSFQIVINSAGVFYSSSILSKKCTAKEYLRVLSINVIGTFNVAKAASSVLIKQATLNDKGERGVIINVASIAGIEGQGGLTIYGGTKGAILGMTLPLARDLGKFGVRVVTIAPGPFLTPMEGQVDEKYIEHFSKTIPLGRLGDPEEFADICVSSCKNSYLNGIFIRIDGGLRLSHL